MRLSRQLGRTKAELIESLSEDELIEQLAFHYLEPLDDHYWRTGLLIEAIQSMVKGKNKKLHPENWIPIKKERKMNLKGFVARANAWARIHNKNIQEEG